MRAGITIHSGDHTLKEILEYGRAAETLQYQGFWLTEESGKEAFSVLSILSARTKKIRVGTGIVNIYSRTPTLLAMSISTLDEISLGRAFLGLGTGGIGFITRGHGLKIEDPVNRMREYVSIIRKLISFDRLSYDGKYFQIKNFQLRQKPTRKDVSIYLAGLNPKMQQLAGEVADGTIVNMLTDAGIKEIRENIKIGAERTGRDPSKVGIYTLSMTLCGQDPSAYDAMKKTVAFYAASPHYHHIMASAGYGDIASKVKVLWDQNKHEEALHLIPEGMVEALTITGTPHEIRKKTLSYISSGVYPIVYPIVRHGSVRKDTLYAMKVVAGKL
ncbi:MAG: LLM class flavin-dependent oxidoreductase [Thaumarchaeota archaeon]|nr:LLM class flavin-dependent oxidoreductase [Nitrososphaerota archaeon]